MARDIVCDMPVNEEDAAGNGLISNFKGHTFYFCGKECKRQFDVDPDKFGKDKPTDLYAGPAVTAAQKPATQRPPTVM